MVLSWSLLGSTSDQSGRPASITSGISSDSDSGRSLESSRSRSSETNGSTSGFVLGTIVATGRPFFSSFFSFLFLFGSCGELFLHCSRTGWLGRRSLESSGRYSFLFPLAGSLRTSLEVRWVLMFLWRRPNGDRRWLDQLQHLGPLGGRLLL